MFVYPLSQRTTWQSTHTAFWKNVSSCFPQPLFADPQKKPRSKKRSFGSHGSLRFSYRSEQRTFRDFPFCPNRRRLCVHLFVTLGAADNEGNIDFLAPLSLSSHFCCAQKKLNFSLLFPSCALTNKRGQVNLAALGPQLGGGKRPKSNFRVLLFGDWWI